MRWVPFNERMVTAKAEIENVLDLFPSLKDKRNQKAGVLSTGEQQLLAMGRALMQKPKLLLADEPSLGLSPSYIDIIFDKLIEINKSGTSILLVEQAAFTALEIAHRGYVFNVGQYSRKALGNNFSRSRDSEIDIGLLKIDSVISHELTIMERYYLFNRIVP